MHLLKREKGDVSTDRVNTVIGKGTFFKGTIKTNGIVRVDGEMEGDIITQGDVIIGESGKVKVEIKAANVAIAGSVEGNIDAEGKMELRDTGALVGDVKAYHLAIDDGALFKGNCEMKNKNENKNDKKNVSNMFGQLNKGDNGRYSSKNKKDTKNSPEIVINEDVINEDLLK